MFTIPIFWLFVRASQNSDGNKFASERSRLLKTLLRDQLSHLSPINGDNRSFSFLDTDTALKWLKSELSLAQSHAHFLEKGEILSHVLVFDEIFKCALSQQWSLWEKIFAKFLQTPPTSSSDEEVLIVVLSILSRVLDKIPHRSCPSVPTNRYTHAYIFDNVPLCG